MSEARKPYRIFMLYRAKGYYDVLQKESETFQEAYDYLTRKCDVPEESADNPDRYLISRQPPSDLKFFGES